MGGESLGVFLFTDVVGSTRLWADHTDAMQSDLARHDEVLRRAITAHGGREFSTAGDSFAASFDTAPDAVAAAVAAQSDLGQAQWRVPEGVSVRMGIHVGAAQQRGEDWFGPPLNETARIMGTGHGGQVVVSDAIASMVRAEHVLRDLGEHQLRDLDGTWRLHQVDVPGADNDHPPLRSLQTGRTTLPRRRTALIGREHLVGELQHLLATNRLVTLVGPGGAGKTHAATEAAGRMLSRSSGAVYFVDLTKIRSGDDVVAAFLDGLGTATAPEIEPRDHLMAFLGASQAILVVDNCEHVIDDAAELVDEILSATTDVRILATSREALDLDGEHLHRIPPLDGDSGHSPAVRLFVERSLAFDTHLPDDDHTMATIAEITRRLDGMPLAIELAAARTRTLSPAQILDHLSDRFRLLTSGRQRGRQRRQQTLAAAIEWSYDLLDADEQRAFRWLATAASGLTIETAAGLLGTDELAAVELVDSLVARSLVVAADRGGTRVFSMLETLGEFGLARLAEHGETDDALRALDRALMPPAEIRTEWDRVMVEFAEWSPRIVVEVDVRRRATARALADGRWEDAAIVGFTASSPDAPGALEQHRRSLLPLTRHLGEMSEVGVWFAGAVLAQTAFFTGRGAACLAMVEDTIETSPADARRLGSFAWQIYIRGSLDPTAEILALIEQVRAEVSRFEVHERSWSECSVETTAAARLHLIGEDDEALDCVRAAVSLAHPGGAQEAQSLALYVALLRHGGLPVPTDIQRRIEVLCDSDMGLQNLVAISEAVTRDEPVAARAGRLVQLARRRTPGRYQREESQYLVAFAQLALEEDDHDRARRLTEVSMPWDVPTYLTHYKVRAQIDAWDDFEEGFATEAARIYSRPHNAVADQAPGVLDAEVRRWEAVLSAPSPAPPSPPVPAPPRRVRTTVSVLGPLEVAVDGTPVEVTAPKQRAVLCALATAPDRSLSTAELVEAAWGDDPAESSVGSLRSQISRLRKLLGADVVVGDSATGYRLAVEPADIDAHRFVNLLDSVAGTPAQRVETLEAAVQLWRGAALSDLADTSTLAADAVALDERRLGAEEDLASALVEDGSHARAIALLERLVEQQPLRERRWTLLVDALRCDDRVADALRAYQRARQRLIDELGIEPGPSLRDAEARALAAGTTPDQTVS